MFDGVDQFHCRHFLFRHHHCVRQGVDLHHRTLFKATLLHDNVGNDQLLFGGAFGKYKLPDIAKYATTLPDNVQVITVCLGLDGEAEIEAAKSTLQDAGFSGITLMEGDGDFSDVCDEIQYTPTTIFVDKDGNTVGDAIISAVGADQMAEAYTQHINDALRKMGQPTLQK